MKTSRRNFVRSIGIGLALSYSSSIYGNINAKSKSPKKAEDKNLKLGIASFTFKEYNLDQAIQMTKRVGIKHLALKSFHLPMDSSKEEIIAAAEKVRSAGLDLYGCSVVILNNEKEVDNVFEYARNAGMGMIIAQPKTDMLPLLEKKVKEYDIKFAIHNHGPEDHNFPSPLDTYKKIENMDEHLGLCIDIGHVRRSGFDPAECIRKCAPRLMDIHIKDLNSIQLVADVCEVGRGKLNIPEVLKTLIGIRFQGIVAFEYEKDLNDPMAGLAESIGYTRGVLSML